MASEQTQETSHPSSRRRQSTEHSKPPLEAERCSGDRAATAPGSRAPDNVRIQAEGK